MVIWQITYCIVTLLIVLNMRDRVMVGVNSSTLVSNSLWMRSLSRGACRVQCLPWMMAKVRNLSSGHPVAEVFLIGWAFAYMIEGCSGFGTPVALAAPMLVSLGHPPVESIVCCLIMNTLATVYAPSLHLYNLNPRSWQ